MNEVSNTEKRAFQLHKDILWSIIQSQAGSLGKAILELVMNSIDAGCTKVEIKLTGTTLHVSDDGKGFVNRQEIESFFETFGTPHEVGDATFGRFRMGRGQSFAYTRSRWKTGNFEMFVDIRDLGLAYQLNTVEKAHKGCTFEGELYDPLSPSDLIRAIDNLRELCKYAPVPVLLNGERISVDLSKQKWTMEDENAYYLLKPAGRSLEVYNLGVFVRNYYSGDYGVGGVVVSKVAIEVNFARNDVLISKCPVWKQIGPKLRAYAKKFEEKKPVQNDAYRDMMMEKLLSGSFETQEEMEQSLRESKVFTDYSGKNVSLEGLQRAVSAHQGRLIAPNDFSVKADRVQQRGLALVLSPKTLERANDMPIENVLKRIISNIDMLMEGSRNSYSYGKRTAQLLLNALSDLDDVASSINEKHDIVDEKTLSKEEALTLKVIREVSRYIAWGAHQQYRHVKVCSSETVDGYTDGKTVIFIERGFLKIGGNRGAAFSCFDAIKALLCHEYIHDGNDSEGHDHQPEFYKEFHDLISDCNQVHDFTYRAATMYVSERLKAGFKMRNGDLSALDALTVEQVEESSAGDVASSGEHHIRSEKPMELLAAKTSASSQK